MSEKLSILFYVRKNYVNKLGKSSVMIRISRNCDMLQFSSGLEIEPVNWDDHSKKMRGRSDQANVFNQTLYGIQSKILENFGLLKEYKIPRTLKNIRDSIQKADFFEEIQNRQNFDTSIYFLQEYRTFIIEKANTIGTLIEKITWDKYDRTFRKLSEFIYFRYKNTDKTNYNEIDKYIKREKPDNINMEVEAKNYNNIEEKNTKKITIGIFQSIKDKNNYIDIRFSDIDFKFVKDFETYLAVNLNLSHNTKSKEMQILQGFIGFALNMQWLQRDPFHSIRITYVESDRTFLYEQDLIKIMSRSFEIKRIEHVRDIFVFSCYTGFAFTDVSNLTTDCIHEIEGKLWIGKSRIKTKVSEMVPLMDIPLRIIKKYQGLSERGYILPHISLQKMNAYLKETADIYERQSKVR